MFPLSRSILAVLVAGTALMTTPVLAAELSLPGEVKSHLESLPDNLTRIEYLKEQIQGDPKNAALLFRAGNLLFDEGQLDDAAAHLQQVTEIKPDYVGAFVNLGSVYDELGKLDLALETYDRALELQPDEEKTLCNIGGVYFKKRQISKALASFQRALEVSPSSQLAHYNIAILFADAGIYREAEAEWQKAVDIDPNSDLGSRSADNIQIIRQLQEAKVPELQDDAGGHDHDHSDHSGHSH